MWWKNRSTVICEDCSLWILVEVVPCIACRKGLSPCDHYCVICLLPWHDGLLQHEVCRIPLACCASEVYQLPFTRSCNVSKAAVPASYSSRRFPLSPLIARFLHFVPFRKPCYSLSWKRHFKAHLSQLKSYPATTHKSRRSALHVVQHAIWFQLAIRKKMIRPRRRVLGASGGDTIKSGTASQCSRVKSL